MYCGGGKITGKKDQYIKNKAFDDKYFKDLLLNISGNINKF